MLPVASVMNSRLAPYPLSVPAVSPAAVSQGPSNPGENGQGRAVIDLPGERGSASCHLTARDAGAKPALASGTDNATAQALPTLWPTWPQVDMHPVPGSGESPKGNDAP
jgi:hypothetical protein